MEWSSSLAFSDSILYLALHMVSKPLISSILKLMVGKKKKKDI